MVKLKLYQCKICKLHYSSKEMAKRCYDWCPTHESCNLEIARNSVEAISKNKIMKGEQDGK